MNFYFAITIRAQRRQLLQMFFEIFLFRIEEAVLGRSSVGIPMCIGEFAVVEAPAVDSSPLRRQVDLTPGGLKVIDKAEHDVDWFIGHMRWPASEIAAQPNLHV